MKSPGPTQSRRHGIDDERGAYYSEFAFIAALLG